MDRRIGVGVIGLGWMGRVHTSAYRRVLEHFPDLGATPRLVVAADVSPQRRAHAERVGFERTTEDWRAVLDDPAVEAVSITLPNAMHREVALAAIEAGKHVWVEKPVGLGLEDTAAVADAARAAGTINAVGFCYRFAPAVQHARALIALGRDRRGQPLPRRVPRRLRQPARRRRVVALPARRRRLGRARRPDGPHRRHDPLPRRPDRAPQRPHRDDDPAPAAAADRRGHALQPRRDRRPRRRRERGLGGRADRARGRHRRLARGQPRDRRPARAHALRGPRHQRRARVGARADERAAALRAVRGRARRGLHDGLRRRRSTPASPPSSPAPACRWATTTCACSRRPPSSARSATASSAAPAWRRCAPRRPCSPRSSARRAAAPGSRAR